MKFDKKLELCFVSGQFRVNLIKCEHSSSIDEDKNNERDDPHLWQSISFHEYFDGWLRPKGEEEKKGMETETRLELPAYQLANLKPSPQNDNQLDTVRALHQVCANF